jgi:hypothetical protein
MNIDQIYEYMRTFHNKTFREVVYAASRIADRYIPEGSGVDMKLAAEIEKTCMYLVYNAIKEKETNAI